jgi:hypothetical protein
MSPDAGGKSPYRVGDTPLARYPLRTARLHCVGLALGVALVSVVPVGLLAIDFHGIYLGVAGWALLIASVCFAFWLATLFPRYCVAKGGEIVVHGDRVLVPRAFSGPPDEVPLHELELEVQIDHRPRRIEIGGRTRGIRMGFAKRVTIGRVRRPRILAASVFTDPAHPFWLASDVRRVRQGLAPEDHESTPDPAAVLADIENVFGDLFRGKPAAPKGEPAPDDYDARLDEELRALDTPEKRGKK